MNDRPVVTLVPKLDADSIRNGVAERVHDARGRSRAEAIRAGLMAIVDDGRSVWDITAHDANAIFAAAALFDAMAGRCDPPRETRPMDSPPAQGVAATDRMLSPVVEDAARAVVRELGVDDTAPSSEQPSDAGAQRND